MVTEKSIQEFREAGMLWFANSLLHVFGWAIVAETNDAGQPVRLYPARVKYRGFSPDLNDIGYSQVSQYMQNNADILLAESKEEN